MSVASIGDHCSTAGMANDKSFPWSVTFRWISRLIYVCGFRPLLRGARFCFDDVRSIASTPMTRPTIAEGVALSRLRSG